jgi:flagellar hook-associated protein 2
MVYPVGLTSYLNAAQLLRATFGWGTAGAASPLSAIPVLAITPATLPGAGNVSPQAQTQALTGLVDYARQLAEAAAPLKLTSSGNVWKRMTVSTSAPSGVTGTALPGAAPATYTLNVTSVAVAQVNLGRSLTSSATTGLAPGTYTFALTVNGTTRNISFTVSAGATEQTVLNNMARAINAAGAGVTAAVANDLTTGTSRLSITAAATGTAGSFSLADVTGNAVAYTGANTVATPAANASYTLSGVPYSSASNTVYLQGGLVQLKLLAPVTGATVTVGYDQGAVTQAVSNFVSAYNNLVLYVQQNQNYLAPGLGTMFREAYRNQAPFLRQAGITMNASGTLNLDQAALSQALSVNRSTVEQALAGPGGLAVTAGNLAQTVATSPLNAYAAPTVWAWPVYNATVAVSGWLPNLTFWPGALLNLWA